MLRLGGGDDDDVATNDRTPSSSNVLTVPTVPSSSGVFLVVLILRQKSRMETKMVATAMLTSNDISVIGSIVFDSTLET